MPGSSKRAPISETSKAKAERFRVIANSLEQENTKLHGMLKSWMHYHSLASLLLKRVQDATHEHKAEDLPVAIDSILKDRPPVNGRAALQAQIIDSLTVEWMKSPLPSPVSKAAVGQWLRSHRDEPLSYPGEKRFDKREKGEIR